MLLKQTDDETINFLLSIIEQLSDIILIEDLNHQFVFSNEYTAKLFGYKDVQTMLGINAYDMRCPAVKSADKFIAQDKQVIQKQTSLNLLDIHQYADDTTKVLLTKKKPILIDGTIQYTLCHCREIHKKTFQQFGIKIAQADRYFEGAPNSSEKSYQIVGEQDRLSKREVECMFYLLRGKSAAQIADILFLSKRTVENHFANIKQKLNCNKKSMLVEYGINQGYLNLIPESLLKQNITIELE